MANTTFTDFQAPAVNAAWLNDVNTLTYTIAGNNGPAPTTITQLLSNLGVSSSATIASTYLTQTSAASTYLTQTNAASTYLTQANAASTYVAQTTVPTLQGAFKNLQVSSTGTNANISITADEIVLESAGNLYQTVRSVNLTINTASSGVNGLDTGTLSASTWYAMYVISNGTTTAGLISLSSTSPIMPANYLTRARIGWCRTDGTANKYPLGFKQDGRNIQYVPAAGSNLTAIPIMASGTQGTYSSTPTWAAIGVSNFVPPTAGRIRMSGHIYANGAGMAIAPNITYNAASASSGLPPMDLYLSAGGTQWGGSEVDIILESTNIYVASSTTSSYVSCLGWEDNL